MFGGFSRTEKRGPIHLNSAHPRSDLRYSRERAANSSPRRHRCRHRRRHRHRPRSFPRRSVEGVRGEPYANYMRIKFVAKRALESRNYVRVTKTRALYSDARELALVRVRGHCNAVMQRRGVLLIIPN